MSVSPTLAINEEIARRRAAGLSTVALGFGEASIPVHPELVRRLAAHAHRGDYGPVAGAAPLLEAAAGYWTRRGLATTPDQVLAGPGTKPLLYALFAAFGGPVLLPQPSWVSYAAQNLLLGQEAVGVPILPGQGGLPDPAELDRTARRLADEGRPASLVLVTIPDNPTGTVAEPGAVQALTEVARRHDLAIISDEIYLDLVHDDTTEVLTPGQVLPEQTITTTGLSKSLALGGWRIGVARFPERYRDIQARVAVAASEIWSAPAQPVQQAAAWALTEPPVLRDRIAASRLLHGRVARAVAQVFADAGADVAPPTAGFYLYPDFEPVRDRLEARGIATGTQLAETLLNEHGVATLPGAAFGDDDRRLALRVATPMLYGETTEQRMAGLESPRPAELPWVADSLAGLRQALEVLVGAADAVERPAAVTAPE